MAKITLIVTGGVRAAKQWDLTLRLQRRGHDVRCITTNSALLFLIPYYLRRPWRIFRFLKAWHSPFGEWMGYIFHRTAGVAHINAAKWGDAVIVAPATCNSLSKLVSGITDNFAMLTIRAAARHKTVIVAPSMNPEMWFDPFIQKNIDRLNQTRKYVVVAPRRGEMRSGDVGAGAMAPDDAIVDEVCRILKSTCATKRISSASDRENRATANGLRARHIYEALVVDPDKEFVSRLSAVARKAYPQLHLTATETADGAVERALRCPPSVIIVEIDLPGKTSGEGFIRELRRHPDLNRIPVITVSEKAREQCGWERLAMQGIAFIPKPLKPRFLLQTAIGQLTVGRDKFR